MKRIWKFLNGKKTIIGLSMHLGWFVANLAFKSLASPSEVATGHILIGTVTGVGIGHKIEKNKDKISETLSKLAKSTKR